MKAQFVLLMLLSYFSINMVTTTVIPCDAAAGWIHTCDDGHCIDDGFVCDGILDCPDGSDEKPYNSSSEGFECTIKSTRNKCSLPQRLVCDFRSHCLEDECNCPNENIFECSPEECVRGTYFCDGASHCSNGKDEIPYRNKSEGILCPSDYSKHPCVLPEEHRCDGTTTCVTEGDECFCGYGEENSTYDATSYFDESCFRCLDGHGEMSLSHMCDGFFDCPDLSDECLCINPPTTCYQLSYKKDCEFNCRRRNVTDERELCIEKLEVCDGKRDCPFGEDEKFCQFVSTIKSLTMETLSPINMPEFWCCNAGYPADCLYEETYTNETYDGCDVFYVCPYDPLYVNSMDYAIKCDGILSCTGAYDECLDCPDNETKPYCKTGNQYGFKCPNAPELGIFDFTDLCDGAPACNPSEPFESMDELNCSETRFQCMVTGGRVSIPIERVCDCTTDCISGTDEANCPDYSNFCCRSGGGVSKHSVCDDIEDCPDGSDECQSCIESPFADDKHLISNIALRAFIWIIGSLSTGGNVFVLIQSSASLKNNAQNVHGRIMTLHIIALAVADLCVGLYLVALAITEVVYSGVYCYEDKTWRSGNFCNAFGVLSTFGLEASVFIQTAVTAHRLKAAISPFRRPSQLRSSLIILFVILFALLLAVIPTIPSLEDYFTSHVRFSLNPFIMKTVSRQEANKFGNKIISYESIGESFESTLG